MAKGVSVRERLLGLAEDVPLWALAGRGLVPLDRATPVDVEGGSSLVLHAADAGPADARPGASPFAAGPADRGANALRSDLLRPLLRLATEVHVERDGWCAAPLRLVVAGGRAVLWCEEVASFRFARPYPAGELAARLAETRVAGRDAGLRALVAGGVRPVVGAATAGDEAMLLAVGPEGAPALGGETYRAVLAAATRAAAAAGVPDPAGRRVYLVVGGGVGVALADAVPYDGDLLLLPAGAGPPGRAAGGGRDAGTDDPDEGDGPDGDSPGTAPSAGLVLDGGPPRPPAAADPGGDKAGWFRKLWGGGAG